MTAIVWNERESRPATSEEIEWLIERDVLRIDFSWTAEELENEQHPGRVWPILTHGVDGKFSIKHTEQVKQ